jgi:hypothetical protein
VPTKNVRLQKLLGNPLLARIDDFRTGGRGGDLRQVLWFNGITEDDAGHFILLICSRLTLWAVAAYKIA